MLIIYRKKLTEFTKNNPHDADAKSSQQIALIQSRVRQILN